MASLKYWLWLAELPGLRRQTRTALLRRKPRRCSGSRTARQPFGTGRSSAAAKRLPRGTVSKMGAEKSGAD